MPDPIICVENLAKSYLVGHLSESHRGHSTLRELLGQQVKNLRRTAFSMLKGQQIVIGNEVEEFWALQDVSFEVGQGEVIGIVGRNGAGKSTLLKILSRITEPTKGRVTLRGRVASLLEVGTGFHGDLSGRENIFLNGAILGMSRNEIRRKFDEIVEFAGVEKFLDTPVKRYSSGMYVRLAFAVAAHLEPEILVVDEVLAVGDVEFQKKCLGKMKDVAACGRTVLFVSHNMAAVRALCTRAILLKQGNVVANESPAVVIDRYLEHTRDSGSKASLQNLEGMATGLVRSDKTVRVLSARITDAVGIPSLILSSSEVLYLNLEIQLFETIPNLRCMLFFKDNESKTILISQSVDSGELLSDFSPGKYTLRCEIPGHLFGSVTVNLDLQINNPKIEHLIYEDLFTFRTTFEPNELTTYGPYDDVFFRPTLPWSVLRC